MRAHPEILSEWCGAPGTHRNFDRFRSKFSLRHLRTALACMAMGMAGTVVVASTVAPLTQGGEQPAPAMSPAMSTDRTPSASIESTFATIHAAPANLAWAHRLQVADVCSDFDSSFLKPACVKIRPAHAIRPRHRVATLVMGHPAVSAAAAPPSDAAVGRRMIGIQTAEKPATPVRDVLDGAPTATALQAASTPDFGKCDPRQGCYAVAQGDHRWLSSVLSYYQF